MNINKVIKSNALFAILLCLFVLIQISVAEAGITIQSIPNSGLQAHWTFDAKTIDWNANTVSDVSGNGNTGTLVFMDVSSNQIIGKRAQAIYTNGYDNSISLATNPISDVSQSNSVCAWVKNNDISQFPGGWYQTFLNMFTDNNNGISIGSVVNAGNLFVAYRSGGNYYGAQSTSAVFVNNVWVHVCYVWNGSGLNLYANSISLATTTNTDGAGSLNTIGARNNIGDGAWLGSIDDLRIYNRALSAKDVELIYKSGALALNTSPSKTVVMQRTPTNFLTNGLVGYWSFDGSKINWGTNTATDSSGYGNNGALTGMSTTTSPVQGKIGQAMFFDGVDDRMSIPYASQYNIRNAISFSVWIKRTTGFSQLQDDFILSRPPAWYFYDAYNSGNIRGDVYIDSTRRAALTTSVPFDGKWYHIIYTYDSDTRTANIYKNGVLADSVTLTGLGNYLIDASMANFIDMGSHSLGRGIVLDEPRIYNRALSVSEVKQLYNQGK